MSSTAAPAGRIHIDDLAAPRFSPQAQSIIDAMSAMADHCPLTAEALHEQATAQTGLTDFGDQDYLDKIGLTPAEF
ncbi:MAG TPA: sulfotransferase, partial [Mycolicibacterium fallax]|nr:sulfotransferase [Mycolicibacterium fallax]